ncbi:MAG: hypothetical protein RLZ98_1485 [Pseudomonadota bacterium]
MTKSHIIKCVAVAFLGSSLAGPSIAEDAKSPTLVPCFEVIRGSGNIEPAAPMLINKCTGETFLLKRLRGSADASAGYAWVPLVTRRRNVKPQAASKYRGRGRNYIKRRKALASPPCFKFDGRTFCE